jgi:hypothetical protein
MAASPTAARDSVLDTIETYQHVMPSMRTRAVDAVRARTVGNHEVRRFAIGVRRGW